MFKNALSSYIPNSRARVRGDEVAATVEPATLHELTTGQIAAMPLPELALMLLHELHLGEENSQNSWRLRYFSSVPEMLGNPAPAPRSFGMDDQSEAALALNEAWQFLFVRMLLCDDLARTADCSRGWGLFRITRRGQRVLAHGLEALRGSDDD